MKRKKKRKIEKRKKEEITNPTRPWKTLDKSHWKGVCVNVFLVQNKEEIVDNLLALCVPLEIAVQKLSGQFK